MSLAGFGQQSVQSTGQLGAGAASRMGQSAMYGGDAQAAGAINQANVWTTGIRDAANQLNYWNQNRNLPNTNYVAPGSGYVPSR